MNPEVENLIFHCDCNNFYASCECLERPELKNVPMAVAGDPEYRTGIVVAKNELAKKAGVKTTDTVWQARKKCPNIVFVPPRHRFYSQISAQINAIYHEYTEFVEPASIDESFLDMTGATRYYGMDKRQLADELRRRIREEVGVTISVGVSFNRVFAKMGSDYKKPDATTVITRENFREIIWPLPVSDLLFAGKATVEALHRKYIFTVGDLARCDRESIVQWLGKGGDQLWRYANGMDSARVRQFGEYEEAKSISHGMTFKRNLVTLEEVRTGIGVLVDDVARQLRRQNMKGSVIQVQIKSPDLKSISRQVKLNHHTCLQHEIREVAMALMLDNWNIGPDAPIRAITVGVSQLSPADAVAEQISLFDMGLAISDSEKPVDRAKQEKLEATVEKLRLKHGRSAITLGFQKNEAIGIGRSEH